MTPTAADRAREIVGEVTFGPGVEDRVVNAVSEALETIRADVATALAQERAEGKAEGLEAGAKIAEQTDIEAGTGEYVYRHCRRAIAAAIRAAKEA